MHKSFYGEWPATIISYNGETRTAMVHIPTVTDGAATGIEATFAYPVGHDDRDTEIEIKAGETCECYVFFLQGDPASPVIFAYRSHGKGAIVDYRRIRQKNIELLAAADINLNAEQSVGISAGDTVTVSAENKISLQAPVVECSDQLIVGGVSVFKSDLDVLKKLSAKGGAALDGGLTIDNKKYTDHGHLNVKGGSETSGGVAP